MYRKLRTLIQDHGNKSEFISINCLPRLKQTIDHFKKEDSLNDFQKWIVNDLYQLSIPEYDFPVRSILLVALPHPSLCKIKFSVGKKDYSCINPAVSDFDSERAFLTSLMDEHGIHYVEATNLPLKRLTVHSNLGRYGKNNICFIDGYGSFFSLIAYYTDVECDEVWYDSKPSELCKNCTICTENCPTGAISSERFLIDNVKCLSLHNENPDTMPEWIPKDAHHTMYDCLKCQLKCPMNQKAVLNTGSPIELNEDEMNHILHTDSYDKLPSELQDKLAPIGIDSWYGAIARNIQLLINA